MDDFLTLAVAEGWSRTLGVTQQPHAPRAMLGTVELLKDRQLTNLVVAPVWSFIYDCSRECYGSQRSGPLPRFQWIDEEIDRILSYQQRGDLATLDELLEYLMRMH